MCKSVSVAFNRLATSNFFINFYIFLFILGADAIIGYDLITVFEDRAMALNQREFNPSRVLIGIVVIVFAIDAVSDLLFLFRHDNRLASGRPVAKFSTLFASMLQWALSAGWFVLLLSMVRGGPIPLRSEGRFPLTSFITVFFLLVRSISFSIVAWTKRGVTSIMQPYPLFFVKMIRMNRADRIGAAVAAAYDFTERAIEIDEAEDDDPNSTYTFVDIQLIKVSKHFKRYPARFFNSLTMTTLRYMLIISVVHAFLFWDLANTVASDTGRMLGELFSDRLVWNLSSGQVFAAAVGVSWLSVMLCIFFHDISVIRNRRPGKWRERLLTLSTVAALLLWGFLFVYGVRSNMRAGSKVRVTPLVFAFIALLFGRAGKRLYDLYRWGGRVPVVLPWISLFIKMHLRGDGERVAPLIIDVRSMRAVVDKLKLNDGSELSTV